MGLIFFAFFEKFFVPILTSGGLAAVSSSFFAALCSAFGRYDVVHIHAEGPAFFCWIPKLFGKKMPNTEFVFIGYGPSADKMKDIPNVKYLGFKTGEELYRIIAEAAISVCPSEWYENCPYSVMESVLLGTPVVGSKMGGIPELIESGKTGELFEAGNVEDLMKAIKKVLQTQDVLERYTKNCSQVNYETTESYYVKLMKIYRGEKNVEQISS